MAVTRCIARSAAMAKCYTQSSIATRVSHRMYASQAAAVASSNLPGDVKAAIEVCFYGRLVHKSH